MVSYFFTKVYKLLCVGVFFLIGLGGAVRAMDAGLACPDWPLCFGDVIPDYHPQVYLEFVHRIAAGLISVLTLLLNGYLLRHKEVSWEVKILAGSALGLLAMQVLLGGLTVLWQLQAFVVTAHLALGTGLLVVLSWVAFCLDGEPASEGQGSVSAFSRFTFGVVYGQILLGGLVASHYAALVCTDFPLCHGELVPTLKGTVGLQVLHRLGAYFTTAVVAGFVLWAKKSAAPKRFLKVTNVLLILVLAQVGLGVANVLLYTPPLITVAHLMLGTALLITALKCVYISRGFSYEVESHEPVQAY